MLGQPISVSLRDGEVVVGKGAKLIQTDIQAQNGVIHFIDTVLLPTSATPAANDAESDTEADNEPSDAVAAATRIYALAVNRGVALFNNGQIAACAAVYEVAVESMIGLGGERLGSKALARLKNCRTELQAVSSARDQAWALRRALDDAYTLLQPTPPQRDTLPAK